MKYFFIAGEASGDLHASNLMREILRADPMAGFRFMGGDLMESASGEKPILHYRETSFMFLDVLLHLGRIFRNLRRIKREIGQWKPDAVIPVDYPGFNLRIARFAWKSGIEVHYYISPKVWAWKKNRIPKLRKYTTRLYSILPFEADFYRKYGMEVEYYGNPLVDGISRFLNGFEGADRWKASHGFGQGPLVALLAGSRKKEIQRMLPVMTRVAAGFPEYRFVVAGAPSIEPEYYSPYLEGTRVMIVYNETYSLLASSSAAMVCSGTATLETALFHVPQVVLYRTAPLAFALAKRIVKVNFISLVNLILGRELVKEVLQHDLYRSSLRELTAILTDVQHGERIREGYSEAASMLGETGVSQRVAERMVDLIQNSGNE